MLAWGESDRELVFEFHTLIIHDFAAASHKNGQFLNCPQAAGFFGTYDADSRYSIQDARLSRQMPKIQAESGQLENRPLYLLIVFVNWASISVI